MSQERSGAQILVETLVRQGVEYIFGYPGGAVLPIYDALFQQNAIRHILVRQEGGAVHAASCLSEAKAASARLRAESWSTIGWG